MSSHSYAQCRNWVASRPAAEIMVRMERDPGEIYRELMSEFGAPSG
jgi:hypothetical protein